MDGVKTMSDKGYIPNEYETNKEFVANIILQNVKDSHKYKFVECKN
jgi:hypothetical protein